ncbi:TPA: hypothetical protein ACH3X2_005394 [Trebouxia sp. C0005]
MDRKTLQEAWNRQSEHAELLQLFNTKSDPELKQDDVVERDAALLCTDPTCNTADLRSFQADASLWVQQHTDTLPTKQVQIPHHSTFSIQTSDHQALLGAVAALLDGIAGDFVFGVQGSTGRPRGRITLNTIHDMERHNELTSSSLLKWYRFLQVWLDAGWGRCDVMVMLDELRPMLWGHPQSLDHMATISARQLAVYSSKYSGRQGSRHLQLQKDLSNFLNVVQTFFSSPDAIFLPAKDVVIRLSNINVSKLQLCHD